MFYDMKFFCSFNGYSPRTDRGSLLCICICRYCLSTPDLFLSISREFVNDDEGRR